MYLCVTRSEEIDTKNKNRTVIPKIFFFLYKIDTKKRSQTIIIGGQLFGRSKYFPCFFFLSRLVFLFSSHNSRIKSMPDKCTEFRWPNQYFLKFRWPRKNSKKCRWPRYKEAEFSELQLGSSTRILKSQFFS